MSGMPSISIIIPNYNYGQYIEETICSVLNQNYPQIQLIVIDGGSTDNSIEIIKKYNKYINYWVSEKDNGQADAINKGLKVATGQYIAFINSDDTYLENAFNTIFNSKNSFEKDFIYGDVLIGSNLANSKPNKSKNNQLQISSLVLFYYSAAYIIPSQSVFIKRDFLIKNHLNFLNENLHYCMDLDWYCRISLYNPTVYKYKEILSFYRVNSDTKTVSQNKNMKVEALKIAYKYLENIEYFNMKNFFAIRLLEISLFKIFHTSFQPKLLFLIKIILKTNFIALQDRKFLGVFKRTLLGN